MASDGSPYDGPVPRPTVVNPNGPYGAVRSAAAPDGAARAVTPRPAPARTVDSSRRRRIGDLRGRFAPKSAVLPVAARHPSPRAARCRRLPGLVGQTAP